MAFMAIKVNRLILLKIKMKKRSGIIIFPSPLAGHLVSTFELAKQIARQKPCPSITILLVSSPFSPTSPSYPQFNEPSLDITVLQLPLPTPRDDQSNTNTTDDDNPIGIPLVSYIEDHKDAVLDVLKSISATFMISAFIVDMFCITITDIATSLGIPTYLFFSSGAATLAYFLTLPLLQKKHPSGFENIMGIEIPGLSAPLRRQDLPPSMLKANDPGFGWFMSISYRLGQVKGQIINTFFEFESGPLTALMTNRGFDSDRGPQQVYPVGPLLGLDDKVDDLEEHECVKWLDLQPDSSVVFLCFGSMGGFSHGQLREIARGLELSGHRFLWKVSLVSSKPGEPSLEPSQEELNQGIFPDGFLERTKDRGLVYTKWVPQVGILSHRATGGFVSHCGWNSTLESVWFGVPMVAWPLQAEQPMNAFLLVEELGLSLGLEKERNVEMVVVGEELGRVIKDLMEGEDGKKVRGNMRKMKELARLAMDEEGSSYRYLSSLVKEWTLSDLVVERCFIMC